LRAIGKDYAALKWGINGHPISIDKEIAANSSRNTPTSGNKDAKASTEEISGSGGNDAATSSNSVPSVKSENIEETSKAEKKRKREVLLTNMGEDDDYLLNKAKCVDGDVVTNASTGSKQTLVIPMMLKKYLVDEWGQISLNAPSGQKLPVLPRTYTVSCVVHSFLMHKLQTLKNSATTPAEGAAAAELFTSYCDLFSGLQRYFERSLPVALLYRQERAQLDLFRQRFKLRNSANSPSLSVQFCPSHVYGVEHLVRLMVRLPSLLLNNVSSDAQPDANKVILWLCAFFAVCFIV
jgi:hypothetical protein